MPHPPEGDDALEKTVERTARRTEIGRKEGERSIGQNLALIGSLGWLITLPMVMGIFAGRWLDEKSGGGIFWTGACIIAGASLGAWFAWKRMKREEK